VEASYRLLKIFRTWPNNTWWRSSAFIACLQTIQPNSSTEAWDIALSRAIYNPSYYPPFFPLIPPHASTILNSILASFLTWYFFTACFGC
jgi:hypothetical protein